MALAGLSAASRSSGGGTGTSARLGLLLQELSWSQAVRSVAGELPLALELVPLALAWPGAVAEPNMSAVWLDPQAWLCRLHGGWEGE